MKTIIRIGSLLTIITLCSCDMSDKESISPVVATDLPSSCLVGETISFKVYHVAFNGCGKYSKHEAAENGNVITVRFYAKYPQAQMCPDNIPTLETIYYFEATQKGDIYFRFFQDNYNGQEYLLDTLRVL
jgi:hypothetical protein